MSHPHTDSADHAFAREQLSALVDGELAAAAQVAAACAAWKQDASARAAWHGYQLIGDVLRSEDLACEPARDSRFMQSLRERLAAEPVVMAPAPLPSRSGATSVRRRWTMPAAVAASFVAVAGVLLVTRTPSPDVPATGRLANAARPSFLSSPRATPSMPAQPPLAVAGLAAAPVQAVIRDPQLDRYVAAHKQFAGSTALGMPSGFLRNASVEVPGR